MPTLESVTALFGYRSFWLPGNEKLQQLFIELVLKREQEEYKREGIVWKDVTYFNNEGICHMIDDNRKGILGFLDESCRLVGNQTDATVLMMLDKNLKGHAHYTSYQIDPKVKGIRRDIDFRVKHFAGDVTYSIEGFLDKNKDTLFADIKRLLYNSSMPDMKAIWPDGKVDKSAVTKRPPTAGKNFKTSMLELVSQLEAKEPFYVRCIKPNSNKSSTEFDKEMVTSQVRYLGLVENAMVRGAGYAHRQPYGTFLERYKMVCTDTCTRPEPFNFTPMGVNPISPGSPRTYAPCGPSVRVVSQAKSRKYPPTRNILPLLFARRAHLQGFRQGRGGAHLQLAQPQDSQVGPRQPRRGHGQHQDLRGERADPRHAGADARRQAAQDGRRDPDGVARQDGARTVQAHRRCVQDHQALQEVHGREPFNSTPMGVSPISSGSPHVRPMGVHRTCGEPGEIKKHTHPKYITALLCAPIRYKTIKYMRQLQQTFRGVGDDPNHGRDTRWPKPPAVLEVRVVSRSIPPPWRSIRFRLALRTYAPWGVRVVSQAKSRKIPTRNILPLFFASRPSTRTSRRSGATGGPTR